MAKGTFLAYKRQLDITTVGSCPNDCWYCPQSIFKEKYAIGQRTQRLSLENFNTVLSHTPKDVVIAFGGFTEPFLNSDCTSMIESAATQGYEVLIYTTLVGMTESDVHRLAKLPITRFTLHLPDNKGNTKIPVTTEKYKNILSLVLQNIRIDEIVIMNDNMIDNERAGLTRMAPKRHYKGFFNCGKLIKPQIGILPNCDVDLCCMDFGLEHIIGNMLTQTYDEIVESPAFCKIQENRYRLDGTTLCRRCAMATPILNYAIFDFYTKLKVKGAKLILGGIIWGLKN
jgi:hypothetical protein